MDTIPVILSRGVEELLGRASGPLHFRLLMTPSVVAIVAVRAGLRDAREGQPPFLWTILAHASERPRLFRSGLRDIGRILIMALVLDTTYQLVVLRAFHVVQLLIVAVACAAVPYILMRGSVTRIVRRFRSRTGRR